MEIIQLAGYTEFEKLQIAKRYLVKKQREANGLRDSQGQINDAAIRTIINDYTREAGVRNLEREIGTVFRKVARRIAEEPRFKARIKPASLVEYLKKPRFFNEVKKRVASVGVVDRPRRNGGRRRHHVHRDDGDAGDGKFTLTGQLGDVMKESATAAISFLRARSHELGLSDDYFSKHDLHIHVPAGAVPKDGPSAGIGLACSIASLLTEYAHRSELAMTGEITLTGQVLAVGGIKEKVLGAKRAGINKIILPKRNEIDLEDVPKEVRDTMTFVGVDEIADVFVEAFGKRLVTPIAQVEQQKKDGVVCRCGAARASRPPVRRSA